ncbi:MAG: hypothetical protein SH857_14970 [Chitinophagales bacterium]|nr:hypothetical protein [Chitinophagales bacterium]
MRLHKGITNKEKRMLNKLVEENLAEGKELSLLRTRLSQIALLCRLFNKKVEITYETEKQELKTIVTRVWLTTCKSVVLKEGVSIPTVSIKDVKVV